ncbi:TonB protein C-terminal [Prevotellaceae bacterium KH2P17]|nr:TonB protein C-terminal [Prevotellaceae bacterium KH2P17]
MKKYLLAVLFLAAVCTVTAQPAPQYSSVRYVLRHLLYQRGAETNVIDINVEWPERLAFSELRGLQNYLAKQLFQADSASFNAACRQFLQRFGQPVTQQFGQLPDDNKFCYVTCSLQQVGYMPGRFVSFRMARVVSPAKASAQQGDTLQSLFTYDIVNDRVMEMADLLRVGRIESGMYDANFVYSLAAGATSPLPEEVYSIQFQGAAMQQDGLLIDLIYASDAEIGQCATRVSYDRVGSLLAKEARELLKGKPASVPAPQYLPEDTVSLDGWRVYKTVEEYPEYPGGQQAMVQFLSGNLNLSPAVVCGNTVGRMMVAMDVEADGSIGDVRILQPNSPEIDRELVKTLRLMPRWKPGKLDGKAVSTRVTLPINIHLQ